jgi:uncharacterized protein (TIGR00645 family)
MIARYQPFNFGDVAQRAGTARSTADAISADWKLRHNLERLRAKTQLPLARPPRSSPPDFMQKPPYAPKSLRPLSNLIFLSRWLQAPLYVELWHLIGFAMLGHPAPASVITTVKDTETIVMLTVLGLIDVVMIANLLIMVIVGGYETFVSRLNLAGHPDQPEWLSHVNAGILKVKLAMALIGISSIHLLKTFINANEMKESTLLWQVVIHITFVLSALVLAWIDRLTNGGHASPALKH